MKVDRTPEDNYFHSGYVTFSTSRNDGELYYEVNLWNENKTKLSKTDSGKVKDEAHLKELECMEKEIEN